MHRKNLQGVPGFTAVGWGAILLVALATWFPPKPVEASDAVFAVIDGETVTVTEFQGFLARFARNKFYHQVSDERLAAVKAEATEALVQRRLLLQEAKRRGLEGDSEAVDQQLASYEDRYRDTEAWTQIEETRPALRQALLEQSRVSALEGEIRRAVDPGDEELRTFYRNNINLFTEPARAKLRVILIGVQPWQTPEVWEAARRKAEGLAGEIAAGASFSDLAKRNSTHVSAERGGDLGFVHGGTLSAPAQEAVDRLVKGETSPPVRVLEGYALFQLLDRHRPRVRDFADVRDRALKLYQREQTETRWAEFLATLRSSARIEFPEEGGTARPE